MKTSPSLIWVVFFTVLFFGLSTIFKVYINGISEFKMGQEYSSNNNPQEAVVHFERAIRWYIPGLGPQNEAAKNIWAIAEKYESDNSLENAINTYRILRSGFYSTRSFYTPGKEWIVRCNEKIAELMANKTPSIEAEAAKSIEQRKSEYLEILSKEKHPYPFWSLLAVTGFLGWASSAVMFIFKGITKTGQIIARPALYWSGGFLLSYGLWILGMVYV